VVSRQTGWTKLPSVDTVAFCLGEISQDCLWGEQILADLEYVPYSKPWNSLTKAEMLREVQVRAFNGLLLYYSVA